MGRVAFSWSSEVPGTDGIATFACPSGAHEIRFDSFTDAFLFYMSVDATIDMAREDARRELLNEIARIKP